ncbi:MAG: Uncharacterised protein [Flavobacteriia bacterium]|nr:MAG: Uncharacterised protein [Flavobacteriia bacterium]
MDDQSRLIFPRNDFFDEGASAFFIFDNEVLGAVDDLFYRQRDDFQRRYVGNQAGDEVEAACFHQSPSLIFWQASRIMR